MLVEAKKDITCALHVTDYNVPIGCSPSLTSIKRYGLDLGNRLYVGGSPSECYITYI
jgi:hypothetical protein